MPETVITLDRKIETEERSVGLPTNRPLTDGAIAYRRMQIATLFVACGVLALFTAFAANGLVQVVAVVLAGGFGLYAMHQDRHLHRLAALRNDVGAISLRVADEILFSGAIGDSELLDLRERVGRVAGSLVVALSEVLPSECARVRLVGPSGEVPIAATRVVAPRAPLPDNRLVALQALRSTAPVRVTIGDRMTLVVPMWRGDDAVGLLEVVSLPDGHYHPLDAALVESFGQGAVAALRGTR